MIQCNTLQYMYNVLHVCCLSTSYQLVLGHSCHGNPHWRVAKSNVGALPVFALLGPRNVLFFLQRDEYFSLDVPKHHNIIILRLLSTFHAYYVCACQHQSEASWIFYGIIKHWNSKNVRLRLKINFHFIWFQYNISKFTWTSDLKMQNWYYRYFFYLLIAMEY